MEIKPTEYIIVQADTAPDLAKAVTAKMKEGFQPFGNIVSDTEYRENKFGDELEIPVLLQAMIR